MPKPSPGGLAARAESGTELVAEEVTEGQVLDRESAPRRASTADAASSRIGQMLANRYRLERLVAKGGMGRVYLATQLPLERKVAIKLLVSKAYDEEFRQRFFLEASTCARLVHRHIVTVHDYGEAENGELFMAMEYLDGDPLSKVISREIRLESDRACQVALQICRALRCAHKSGIVHRDLKPGNVMLLRDDDQESADFVKVLDFGLVKAFENDEGQPAVDLTRSGTWLGSPRYMAPEQIRCKGVDPRTDIYSLGVILFHMVAGRPPFVGSNSVEILEQHLRDPVPSIRELVGDVHYPPELEEIIRTCMEKDAADRYQSMDEVIVDLKAAYRIATGVSIHTESSLPTMAELGAEAEADSHSSGGSAVRVRTETKLSRPPPAPALGPPPDLGGPPPLPAPISTPTAIPVELSDSGVFVADPTPLPAPATGRRRWPLLALALLLVLGAGFVITRGVATTQTPAAPEPVRLTIRSTPDGAQVLDATGRVLGTTPFVEVVPGSARGETRQLTLRREGHRDAEVKAHLDQDKVVVQASLQPLPAREPAPEVAAPETAETEAKAAAASPSRPRRVAPARRALPPPRKVARRRPPVDEVEPEPEPEPEPTPAVPPAVPTVEASRPTVDEPRRSLLVDEADQNTVQDRSVPVVD